MNAKPLSSPGNEEANGVDIEGSPLLDAVFASRYRALAARANYIAVDRADAQFAIKELCRDMSSPTGIVGATQAAWEVFPGQAAGYCRILLARPR